MAKAGMFAKSEHEELNRITSKSILEKLMNIRQKINVGFTARRLVWELIQNAKDNVSLCSQNDEKVDVHISLSETKFIFSHNKGYFTSGMFGFSRATEDMRKEILGSGIECEEGNSCERRADAKGLRYFINENAIHNRQSETKILFACRMVELEDLESFSEETLCAVFTITKSTFLL